MCFLLFYYNTSEETTGSNILRLLTKNLGFKFECTAENRKQWIEISRKQAKIKISAILVLVASKGDVRDPKKPSQVTAQYTTTDWLNEAGKNFYSEGSSAKKATESTSKWDPTPCGALNT
jgi:hypothetical protein